MKQDQTPFAAQPATDEAASCPSAPTPFDPVPVRARSDGWTPQKQREFIEALADTGVVREAAARGGMTQRSAWRLRGRVDQPRLFSHAVQESLRTMGPRQAVANS